MKSVAVRSNQQIARPLKILIPLIQSSLQQGNSAGREYYTKAGQELLEAKGQVSPGGWSQWLTKNFDLSHRQANEYMLLARKANEARATGADLPTGSMRVIRGATDRDREERQSTQQQNFRRVLRDVAADTFVQERQSRDDEIKLHRDLAEELIDIGYRALATKLHPDRGGSKDAMARLNRVRDELKQIAQTRRFV
jgi:hypothetical protein